MPERWVYSIRDMNALIIDTNIMPKSFGFMDIALETTYVWAQPEDVQAHLMPEDSVPEKVKELRARVNTNHHQHTYIEGEEQKIRQAQKEYEEHIYSLPLCDFAIDYGLGISPYVRRPLAVKPVPGVVAINLDALQEYMESRGSGLTFVEDPEIPGYRAFMMFDRNGAGVTIPKEFYRAVPLTLLRKRIESGGDAESCREYVREKLLEAMKAYNKEDTRLPFVRVNPHEIESLPSEACLAVA